MFLCNTFKLTTIYAILSLIKCSSVADTRTICVYYSNGIRACGYNIYQNLLEVERLPGAISGFTYNTTFLTDIHPVKECAKRQSNAPAR